MLIGVDKFIIVYIHYYSITQSMSYCHKNLCDLFIHPSRPTNPWEALIFSLCPKFHPCQKAMELESYSM